MGFYEKNIDIYIVPSLYVKGVLMEAGMKEAKIVVIPHFVSEPMKNFSQVTNEANQYALYGGSITTEKGVDVLIRTFEKLRIPLILAGSYEDHFVVPKSKYVTFVGKQTKDQMEKLIQGALCVVSGSTLPETFGLLALEAGSFGKPFFGMKTGAFQEIVIDGENGYLASDETILEQHIQDFFSGKDTFLASLIQEKTNERFGEMVYLKRFEEVARSLISHT